MVDVRALAESFLAFPLKVVFAAGKLDLLAAVMAQIDLNRRLDDSRRAIADGHGILADATCFAALRDRALRQVSRSSRPVQPVAVLFAPSVDAALVALVDQFDTDSVSALLDFLESIQPRLVDSLGMLPEAESVFQGRVRLLPIEGWVFLYEYYPAAREVHVLDMIAAGRNWR
jgi:hypothetical protein